MAAVDAIISNGGTYLVHLNYHRRPGYRINFRFETINKYDRPFLGNSCASCFYFASLCCK